MKNFSKILEKREGSVTILYILYYSRRIHIVCVVCMLSSHPYAISSHPYATVRVDVCSRFTHIHTVCTFPKCNILGIEPTHSIVGFQDMAFVVVHFAR